jgi:hypothetical protein
MEEFELQLKKLALASPSKDMKERIFGSEQRSGGGIVSLFRFRIPLGWAAVLAISAGLIGMYTSNYLRIKSTEPRVVHVHNLIISNPSEENPYDFTSNDGIDDFMPGGLKLTIEKSEEI